jgi:hypothetical protein
MNVGLVKDKGKDRGELRVEDKDEDEDDGKAEVVQQPVELPSPPSRQSLPFRNEGKSLASGLFRWKL